MRIIAINDDKDLGLIAETEILGVSDEQKNMLVLYGYARKYDDTLPMVGKSVNVYENLPYPTGRQVFYNDSIYKAISLTETTRAPLTDAEVIAQGSPDTEWEKLTTGKNAL